MSKISQLPLIADPDGSEQAAVVKNGVTYRAPIATGPALAQTNARIDALVSGSDAIRANPNVVELGSAAAVEIDLQLALAPASLSIAVDGGAAIVLDPATRAWQLAGPHPADRHVVATIGGARQLATTVYARAPIFAGIAAVSPGDAAILASPYKALDSDHIARGVTLDRSAGGRPYLVYPAALTIGSIAIGGFAVGGWAESAPANLTLATGAVVSVKRVVLDPVAASPDQLQVTLA